MVTELVGGDRENAHVIVPLAHPLSGSDHDVADVDVADVVDLLEVEDDGWLEAILVEGAPPADADLVEEAIKEDLMEEQLIGNVGWDVEFAGAEEIEEPDKAGRIVVDKVLSLL
ncbi:hypothetical protein ZIOFF_007338 [Zingiber officinale]|uniref:Uncharacterized protein n=1 Tax=Zingiber officinale TaxID=94328 RepID=A0A8J5HQS8_ZINOF|nr:hypothetical protein ZIOFF_007338 [Zingiber officinale]